MWKAYIAVAVLVAGLVGWGVKSYNASLRAEGRIEVLLEQRDSVNSVHEAQQDSLLGEIRLLDSKRDTIRQTVPVEHTDSIVEAIPDTVIRLRVQSIVDTLRLWCEVCEQELDSVTLLYTNERKQHLAAQGVLDALVSRKQRRITFGVSVGIAAVYSPRTEQFEVGPAITFGVNIRVF